MKARTPSTGKAQAAAPPANATVAPRTPEPDDAHRLQRSIGNRATRALLDATPPAGDLGQPLATATRARMEQAFGVDFSSVRVHEGDHVRALGAAAYTQGNDVHFAPGRLQPGTPWGDRLIGHELAHVVQQQQGLVPAPDGMVVRDRQLEAQAAQMGVRAASGQPARSFTGLPAVATARPIQLADDEGDLYAEPAPTAETPPRQPPPRNRHGHPHRLSHTDRVLKVKAEGDLDKIPESWPFIANLQSNALNGIAELAKESEKPGWEMELLVSLCNIALAGGLGLVGGYVASRVEKAIASKLIERGMKAAERDAGGFSDEAEREFFMKHVVNPERLRSIAKWLAEGIKDSAVKQAGKEVIGPAIKSLLPSHGPRLAFFQGLATGYVTAAKQAARHARDQVTDVKQRMEAGELSPAEGEKIAASMLESLDADTTAHVQEAIGREATDAWLTYLARQERGAAGEGGVAHSGSGAERDVGTNLQSRRDTVRKTPGVLYIDVVLDAAGPPQVQGGRVRKAGEGLTEILRNRPIKEIHAPKIFRFWHDQGPVAGAPTGRQHFEVRQTEKGAVFVPREFLTYEGKQWLLRRAGKPLTDVIVPGSSGGVSSGYEGGDDDLVRGALAFIADVVGQQLGATFEPE